LAGLLLQAGKLSILKLQCQQITTISKNACGTLPTNCVPILSSNRPSILSHLGLIFLRYADHKFAEAEKKMPQASGRRKIDKADYQAQGVLYLPEKSRFGYQEQNKSLYIN